MSTLRFSIFIVLFIFLFGPIWAVDNALTSQPISIQKEMNNTIEVVKTYLRPRTDNGYAKIWVYFTDKGFTDKASFDHLASQISLTDRAKTRRAKMGLDKIIFLDLPVYQDYIDAIIAKGVNVRHISRWLNAVSVSVPFDQIDAINQLPFVAKIRPVALFKRENSKTTSIPETPVYTFGEKNPHFLNYGISQGQLEQINVPVVHDKGYNGSGVVVAMFDTGYRKDHEAFADAYATNRVLAEWDFVFNDSDTQNETEDNPDQHRHGTLTWSTLGGAKSGQLYGPAYGASFLLAKTEDVRSETQVEEDNWVAAVEWADSIGVDVISTSLGYSDWYTYSDFDGETATITIAANRADTLGIVVTVSMGNAGPGTGTLSAPADAFGSISVGAVTSTGTITSFSSRGPTYDGRTKPEVCAQGSSTYCASPTSTTAYTYASGTSLSCPLAGGCAAVILSVHPEFTPAMVRQAMIETASQANTPDNTYGWGIINLDAALQWGAKIGADVTMGQVPLEVHFYDSSAIAANSWAWSLGDGDSAFTENPIHTYATPGVYTVGLKIGSSYGDISTLNANYVVALADTLFFSSDTVYAGEQTVIDISLTNSLSLTSFILTFDFSQGATLTLDSVSAAGLRTEDFTRITIGANPAGTQQAIQFTQNGSSLSPGSGPILRLFFKTNPYALGNSSTVLDTVTIGGKSLSLSSPAATYQPYTVAGAISIKDVFRGDANHDGKVNVADPVFIINYVFKAGPSPITIESGDANFDFSINVGDATYLINYIFKGGPPPNDI